MNTQRKVLVTFLIVLCLISISMNDPAAGGRAERLATTELDVAGHMPTQSPPRAGLHSPLDLTALTAGADLIAVGQVLSVTLRGKARTDVDGLRLRASRLMIGLLGVYRVVKGSIKLPTLSFEFADTQSGYQEIRPTQFGMFFLRKAGSNDYAVLDPYHPFVIASQHGNIVEGNDLDRVVAEIARVLKQRTSPAEERRLAVYGLNSAGNAAATDALRQATHDNDTVVRLQAAAALLRRSDISILDMVADNLMNPSSNTEEYLLANLGYALEGIKDPRAIPTLRRLLGARQVEARRGAAAALRNMRMADAIEPLLVALEDRDRDVRYQAVIGLAEITGQNEWGPSVDLFQHDEKPYLAHWREWAKTH